MADRGDDMFNVYVVQALYGDCLLVEYGTPTKRHYLLIDGSPSGVCRHWIQA